MAVLIRGGDRLDLVDVGKGQVVKSLPVKVPHNCYNHGRNDQLFVTSLGEGRGNLVDLKALRYAAAWANNVANTNWITRTAPTKP